MDDIELFKKERIPLTTQKKVKWVITTFQMWLSDWSGRKDGMEKISKPLQEMSLIQMDYCFQFFFVEVRKSDGNLYPPRTLKEMAAALQHYVTYTLKKTISLFKDVEFSSSREALDSAMKKSAACGTVKPRKRAAFIPEEKELELWHNGSFGTSNPQQLLDTVLYHLGLHLALRACQEHRNLCYGDSSQLVLEMIDSEKGVKYTENCSKNKSFGIRQANLEPKITYVYPCPDSSRCVINIYEKYLSHRQENIIFLTILFVFLLVYLFSLKARKSWFTRKQCILFNAFEISKGFNLVQICSFGSK